VKHVFRWVGAVFGLVVFVVLVGIGIGIELPISHVAECSAAYAAPVNDVWHAVFDDVDSVRWRSDVASVTQVSQGAHPVWRETDRHGNRMDYVLSSERPPFSFVRSIAGEGLAFDGSWTYRLVPKGEDTQLVITERGDIYNPVFRLVSRMMGETGTMRRYLTDLGKYFGQSVTVGCAATSTG
jgi:hypothetical protein